MKIAVDAMGGDLAPAAIVRGAVDAFRQHGIEVILVGKRAAIEKELSECGASDLKIEIVHCEEVVGMDEHPASAVRKKRDSSIVVATKLVKEKKADAVVSAGSTGAQMAAALFYLGRIPGVLRPATAIPMPTIDGVSVLLDSGANVDSEPENLVQSAAMGAIYAEAVLGIKNPKVGLLNIGEEETKGNKLVTETYPLLKNSNLNFIGN
ncbi:MAG TPA: phosphate acyltransferase, partial [Firmicutes bacterium]|nr:phosphate acyltransferase [Bacillota bacterium]HBR22995.1 phosphate acyltransferase [Bacillota bacterium]HCM18244.1 phosphate acyltransferase [Bacillota bacterium]